MTRLVPTDVRQQVIALIAADAEASEWDHLSQADKSAWIARWTGAPDIGGVLKPLLGSEADVRLWIKDTALKRRARDLLPQADDVVGAALGPGATVVPGSVGIKPAHCAAAMDGQTWYVCWDRVANAKHLVWAALLAADTRPWLAGVVAAFLEPVTGRTPEPDRERVERLARRCGVAVRWVDP